MKTLILLLILALFPWGVKAGPLDLIPQGAEPTPSTTPLNRLLVSDAQSTTHVISSFQGAVGLYTLNQASGSLNDQSNLVLFNLGEGETIELGISLALAKEGEVALLARSQSRDLIEGSFWNSRGAFLLNQTSGSMNAQGNTLLISIGGGPLLLRDGELELQRPDGREVHLEEEGGVRGDILVDSFNGATGVGLISQSAGNMNAIRNTVGISFRHQVIR